MKAFAQVLQAVSQGMFQVPSPLGSSDSLNSNVVYVAQMHHEFTAPVALASTYCTMTEHCFSNILPIMLGLFIIKAHWSMAVTFVGP